MLVSLFKQDTNLFMLFHEQHLSDGFNFCVKVTRKADGKFVNQCYVHGVHVTEPQGRYSYSSKSGLYYTTVAKAYGINGYKCLFNRTKMWNKLARFWNIAEYHETRNVFIDEVTGNFSSDTESKPEESNVKPKEQSSIEVSDLVTLIEHTGI